VDTDTPARGQRLQKLLASAGLGSRRQIEQWIRDGRLQIDGVIATLGARAVPGAQIRLDGRPVRLPQGLVAAGATGPAAAASAREVLIYHKPLSEVSTRSDPQGRPTVFERLPAPRGSGRWVVIGRLDVNTTGLLLFTTDGELAHRWMHPSGEVEREYLVRVRGQPAAQDLTRLTAGLALEDGMARFERIEPASAGASSAEDAVSHSWYRVSLREGRNREVRRLWQAAGFEVSRLKRLRYGTVRLPDDLPPGRWRWLPAQEAASL
jgi:23S rRNA pseudouridine2605 synthase